MSHPRPRWLIAALLWACNGNNDTPDPTLSIVSPVDGTTASGDTITVEVAVTDFPFEAPTATAACRVPARARAAGPLDWLVPAARAHEIGEEPSGYIEVTLDGVQVADEIRTTFDVDVSGLAAGTHTLEVELLYADGDALYPAVTDAIGFVVP
ncbi:MAG: hypothetical protein H6733_01465 [Alphaproteobacteria bacterium]|nr:hypothetical protein [Alphaproteobacteria bacterium]